MAKQQNWYMYRWEYHPVLNKKGKEKLVLVYMGEYYSFNLSERGLGFLKAVYLLLTLALYTVFLLYLNSSSRGGESFYSGAPIMLAIIPLIYLGMGIFCLMLAGGKMTYRAYYASVKRIIYSARFAIVLLGIGTLGQIIYIAVNAASEIFNLRSELLRLLDTAFCTADIGAMLFLLHKFPAVMINIKANK